jgi:hypothetical protein
MRSRCEAIPSISASIRIACASRALRKSKRSISCACSRQRRRTAGRSSWPLVAVAIRPQIECQIDAWILSHPPEDWALLMRARERVVDKALDTARIINLERRLTEAEARLKPRLVE